MLNQHLFNFVIDRVDAAHQERIRKCPNYLEVDAEFNKLWSDIDRQLSAEQRLLVSRLLDKHTESYCIVEQECYLQGLRDGQKLFGTTNSDLTIDYLRDMEIKAETEKECAEVGATSAL